MIFTNKIVLAFVLVGCSVSRISAADATGETLSAGAKVQGEKTESGTLNSDHRPRQLKRSKMAKSLNLSRLSGSSISSSDSSSKSGKKSSSKSGEKSSSKSAEATSAPTSVPTMAPTFEMSDGVIEGVFVDQVRLIGDILNDFECKPLFDARDADGFAECAERKNYLEPPFLFNRGAGPSSQLYFTEQFGGALGDGAVCGLTDGGSDSDKIIIEYLNNTLVPSPADMDATPVSEFESLSYSYYVNSCSNGAPDCGEQFYANVYTRRTDNDNFFDCRYDYTGPNTGAVPGAFYSITITPFTTPSQVFSFDGLTCPPNLALAASMGFVLGSGSLPLLYTLNIGDTNAQNGLEGCFDAVELKLQSGDPPVFDFETATSS